MNILEMLSRLPPEAATEFLRRYGSAMGARTYSDDPNSPYGMVNWMEQKQEIMDRNNPEDPSHYAGYMRETELLNWLLRHGKTLGGNTLIDWVQKHRANSLDRELNDVQFGNYTRMNSRKMEEMKNLPTGDWNQMPGLSHPVPRRM